MQNREKKDMAAHNGHLTKAEQNGINRQQNRISKSIYKDKHKSAVALVQGLSKSFARQPCTNVGAGVLAVWATTALRGEFRRNSRRNSQH